MPPSRALPTLRSHAAAGAALTIRPLGDTDIDELARIIARTQLQRWWGSLDGIEDDLRQDGHAFAIDVAGALAGWLGFWEELEPGHKHAGLDIMLAPEFHNRRIGRAALTLAARWLIDDREHHRITVDPAHDNERAIRCYTAAGFRPVGILRQYERDPAGGWRDGLLMDLLASELRAPNAPELQTAFDGTSGALPDLDVPARDEWDRG